jgi:hypothetical protein
MMPFEPDLNLTIQGVFVKLDGYEKLIFSITEDVYNLLEKRLSNIPGKHRPYQTWLYEGKNYFNLKIKMCNAPNSFSPVKLAGNQMKLFISFYSWSYMKMTGVRAELNSFDIIETPKSDMKVLDKSKFVYEELCDIRSSDIPECE